MANLDTLTCDYNTLAEANGFPTRSKRFGSYVVAEGMLNELKGKIEKRVVAKANNLRRSLEEVESLTGWDIELVKSLTADERRSVRYIGNLLQAAEESQNKWLENFDKSPIYALRWAEEIAVASYKAEIARQVLNGFESQASCENLATFKEWVKSIRDDLQDQMINNSFKGGYTSAFHNATEDAKRQAVSHLLTSYGFFSWVDFEKD
jgi:hypothetical protein